ncbi:MAG: Mobile element protein, partial [Myxococcaceae bacterium]|nr:Mobile element protein [Myxococcaceae bacterium]
MDRTFRPRPAAARVRRPVRSRAAARANAARTRAQRRGVVRRRSASAQQRAQKIYGEEQKAKQLGLRGDALRAYRNEHIATIADAFCDWMDRVQPSLLPSDPLAAAIRYYKNHKAARLRFLDDPDIPIDNSPTEREFQNVAKLRLNALFVGSSEGAHRACVLLGI